mmetsp:Transcript_16263/g.29585  ORF Transcript_16263/g.29585 Transcript_16263/m.29585 type:complete len:527 (-) Transcript_16263:471-2051(-)
MRRNLSGMVLSGDENVANDVDLGDYTPKMSRAHSSSIESTSSDPLVAIASFFSSSSDASYSCCYQKQKGKLYSSSKALYFLSGTLDNDCLIKIEMKEVIKIMPVKPSAISISSTDCEDCIFQKVEKRDHVLRNLRDLLFQSKVSRKPVGSLHQKDSSRLDVPTPVRRSQSFPVKRSSRRVGQIVRQKRLPALVTRRSINEKINLLNPLRSTMKQHPETASLSDSDLSLSVEGVEGDNEIESSTDLKNEWNLVKSHKYPSFKETALEATELCCTLSSFHDMFLADDAPHSIESYQQDAIGDTNVLTSQWKLAEDGVTKTRRITFCHSSLNPFGPSYMSTTKEQCLRRYGNFGICVVSLTRVSGVPNGDSFFVEEQCMLERINNTFISLRVRYQTRFIKSTMIKKIIERSSRSETNAWYRGYLRMIQEALPDACVTRGLSPIAVPPSTREEPEMDSKQANRTSAQYSEASIRMLLAFCAVLFALMLALFFYVIWLHGTMISLENEILELKTRARLADTLNWLQKGRSK